jgi:2-hydroxyglutarate dehydrogenase
LYAITSLKGLKAVWSPHTGIVDWGLVTQYYGEDFKALGGDIHLNFEVKDFKVSEESKVKALASNKKGVQVTATNGVKSRNDFNSKFSL